MMPAAAAELSWEQVHAFRLERHHLARRAPLKDLVKVTGAIGGAQAQVMSAAELQIGARVECRVSDVRDALWKDRTLVKTWLMRGTLHLIPAEDLPIFTASAVVLVDGRVAGTWSHDVAKKTLRVAVAPFRRISGKTSAEVRRRADSLAATLGLATAEVRFG